MSFASPLPLRVIVGHKRVASGLGLAVLSYLLLPHRLGGAMRSVLAWDMGSTVLLVLAAILFARDGHEDSMAQNAEQQKEGEWTMFWIVLAGVVFSFVALTHELADVKDMPARVRLAHVVLVGSTLFLSWLVTHVVFAMRYAHEYYTTTDARAGGVDGGLDFPGKEPPDYWDFVYFAIVLGMTFQVSDVQITSRKLRRLATVHGLIGFLFNTVIVALTVNIAASLMG